MEKTRKRKEGTSDVVVEKEFMEDTQSDGGANAHIRDRVGVVPEKGTMDVDQFLDGDPEKWGSGHHFGWSCKENL